jgi:hypothetical protein
MTTSSAPGAAFVDIGSARIKAEAVAADAAPRAVVATDVADDVAIGDWDVLMRAVKMRLRSSAELRPISEADPQNALQHMSADVLQCVAALDRACVKTPSPRCHQISRVQRHIEHWSRYVALCRRPGSKSGDADS